MLDKTVGEGWRFCDVYQDSGKLKLDYRFLYPYPFLLEPDTPGQEWVRAAVTFTMRRLVPPDDPSAATVEIDGKMYIGQDTQVFAPDPIFENPWVWRAVYDTTGGNGLVQVIMEIGGKVRLNEFIETAPKVNKESVQTVARRSPRLIVALNSTVVGTPVFSGDFASPGPAEIETILNWIWNRLQRGLEPAWWGLDGSRGLPAEEFGLSPDEERWARTVTEMMACVAYGGPAQSFHKFKGGVADDESIYDKMLSEDPAYPIIAACQQLSTIGLVTRGFTKEHFGPGLNAGDGTSGQKVFDKGHRWRADGQSASVAMNGSPPVAPGSCYLFYTVSSQGGAHIAFVLRVRGKNSPTDPKGWDAIQLFDTGAMQVNVAVRYLNVPEGFPFGAGNFDDPWGFLIPGPKNETYRGVGVPIAPPDLAAAVAKYRTAWPLGFVRLVLRLRAAQPGTPPLYATPLLRMHTDPPDQNYTPARLLWALREMPGKESIEAVWQVSIPDGALAQAMLDGGRGATISVLLENAGLDVPLDQPIGHQIADRKRQQPWNGITSLLDLAVKTDGKVRWSRVRDRPETLPWSLPSGTVTPTNVPPYFAR